MNQRFAHLILSYFIDDVRSKELTWQDGRKCQPFEHVQLFHSEYLTFDISNGPEWVLIYLVLTLMLRQPLCNSRQPEEFEIHGLCVQMVSLEINTTLSLLHRHYFKCLYTVCSSIICEYIAPLYRKSLFTTKLRATTWTRTWFLGEGDVRGLAPMSNQIILVVSLVQHVLLCIEHSKNRRTRSNIPAIRKQPVNNRAWTGQSIDRCCQ